MATSKKTARAQRTSAKNTQPNPKPQMTNEEQPQDERQFATGVPSATLQPGEMLDGSSSDGASSGDVTAIVDVAQDSQMEPSDIDETVVGATASKEEFQQALAEHGDRPFDEAAAAIEQTVAQGERTLLHVKLEETAPEQANAVIDQVKLQFARGQISSPSAADQVGAVDTAAVTTDPQPEPEPFVADNNDTPAIPGDYSGPALSAIHSVTEYIEKMHPKRPLAAADMLRQQMQLYRAIITLINRVEGEEFTRAWTWLLQQFLAYRQGVFAERYVFRGFEDIAMSEVDRKAFQRLLNLLKATADPRGRAVTIKQVDLTKTLELGLTEPGRQRVLQFYGV